MESYSIELFIYVIVMIWIILGCGFRLPALAAWKHDTNLTWRTYVWEISKAIVTWPWFDIKKLRNKYSP